MNDITELRGMSYFNATEIGNARSNMHACACTLYE